MSSWERGYGDFVFKPDMDTLRYVPWQEGTALVTCDLVWEDGSPVVASPRQVLKRQLRRLSERGLEAFVGTELEFIVFMDSYEEAWRKGYRDLEPANYYNVDYSLLGTARIEPLLRRIRNSMAGAGLAVEDAKGECNFGQHEINFRFDRALSDRGRARDLQERRQGDRRPGGLLHLLYAQVRRTRGQLLPHTSEPPQQRTEPPSSPKATVSRRPSSTSSPASSPACASSRSSSPRTSTPTNATPRAPSPRLRSPGAKTTVPVACASSATATPCASRTGCPAGTSTLTWRSRP